MAETYGNKETQDATEHFRLYLEKSGLNNFKEYLEDLLNDWKKYPIHIGVTGQSGVGKSTFINTIRGLSAKDPKAAPVGVLETTKTIESYPDPKNSNFVYWDLPGCGTPNFPRDIYLKTVDFDKFDHLIIITATRFTENDLWLINEVRKTRKSFYLVRNKVNIDLDNEREDQPSLSEQDVLDKIRDDFSKQSGNSDKCIYLISAHLKHYQRWDFPRLVSDLISGTEAIKHNSILLSVKSTTQKVVEQKVEALRNPVACDIALIERELNYYKETLGLDMESLKLFGSTPDEIIENLKKLSPTTLGKKYMGLVFSIELQTFLLKTIAAYAAKQVAKETSRYIPIVGQVVASAAAFSIAYMVLNDALDDLHEAALDFIQLMGSKEIV